LLSSIAKDKTETYRAYVRAPILLEKQQTESCEYEEHTRTQTIRHHLPHVRVGTEGFEVQNLRCWEIRREK